MRTRSFSALASALGLLALPAALHAQSADPQQRPVMLQQGAAITDVVDAADLGSAWSFRFFAGYSSSLRNATLQRERSTITSGMNPANAPEGITPFDNVARYTSLTQTLNLGAEIAIFHDFSLTIGVPVILSQTGELNGGGGASAADAAQRLRDGYTVNGMPSQLFSVPFRSPERSGIDQIRFALNWDILNQARDPHLPTWLVRFEYRAPVGGQLNPCSVNPTMTSSVYCPYMGSQVPGTMDAADPTVWTTTGQRPVTDTSHPTANTPGISRRVHSFFFQTIVSRRTGYIEPYGGMDVTIEVPERSPYYGFGDVPYGQLATTPPIQGGLTAGMEIIPWENRESWQRFVIDVNVRAQYFSQGRDFSALFDALGTSNSIPLTRPSYAINDIDDHSRPVYFNGTTSVHANGRFTAGLGLAIQAARFLRFSFAASMTYTTPYVMTATDACNPNERPGSNLALRGGCVGDAAPDPTHRPVVDLPGQRFRFVDDTTFDLFVNIFLTPRF